MLKKAKLVPYLKAQLPLLLFALVVIHLPSLLVYIFSLEPAIASYCLVLGWFFLLVFLAQDYYRTLKKLEKAKEGLTQPGDLSTCWTLVEAKLLELLKEEEADKLEVQQEYLTRLKDTEKFYTVWAHQIKTPIAAIRLILDSKKPNLDFLAQEMFKVEEYVEMILNFERYMAQDTDYVFDWVDLDQVIRSVIKSLSPIFIKKSLALDFKASQKKVLSDQKWLTFIIGQIVSNSLKYSDSGTIHIYWEGDRLVLADEGIGIRPEDLPRVFDLSYTGYSGRNYQKSTGIGLYLVQSLADELKIKLDISSTLGQGTVLKLSFDQVK